jgi:hypothetical protein
MDARDDSIIVRLRRLEDSAHDARESLTRDLVCGRLGYLDFQRCSADLEKDFILKMRRIMAQG